MGRFAQLALLFACVLCACEATLPDARFRCARDSQCPASFSCVESLCRDPQHTPRHLGPDASSEPDASGTQPPEAGLDGSTHEQDAALDGAMPTSEADAGSDGAVRRTFLLRIVHAEETLSEVAVKAGAEVLATVSYGQTSEAISQLEGGLALTFVDEEGEKLGQTEQGLALSEPSLLVLSRRGGALIGTLLPDDLPKPTEELTSVRFFNATDLPTGVYALPAELAVTFAHEASDVQTISRISPPTFLWVLSSPTDTMVTDLAGSFSSLLLRKSALVVMSGNPLLPLAHADGPRAFVAQPGAPALQTSDAAIHVLNATYGASAALSSVSWCLSALETLSNGEIARGQLIDDAIPAIRGSTDVLHFAGPGVEDACAAPGASLALGSLFDGLSFVRGRRYLVVLHGPTSAPEVAVFAEPARGELALSASSVAFVHAAPVSTSGAAASFTPPELAEVSGVKSLAQADRSYTTGILAGSLQVDISGVVTSYALPAVTERSSFVVLTDSLESGLATSVLYRVSAPDGGKEWTASELAVERSD